MRSKDKTFTFQAHSNWINAVAFSPNSELLLSGSMDETVRFWDLVTGEERKCLQPNLKGINSLAFAPDGKLIVLAAESPLISVYDVSTFEVETKLEGHQGPVNSVQFSPDGLHIISGSDDMTVRVWEVKTGTAEKVMKGHEQRIWATVYANTKPIVASGSEDWTVRLWNPYEGSCLAILTGHTSGISAVAFQPDDATIAAVAFNDEVRFWQARKMNPDTHPKEVDLIEPAGKLPDFADESYDAYSATDSDSRTTQHGHQSAVTCAALSKDASVVVTGSDDGVIKVWDAKGTEIRAMSGHTGRITELTFSHNGERIISASADKTVRLWNKETGDLEYTLAGHSDTVSLVRVAYDDDTLVSHSVDGTIKLWDARHGTLKHSMTSSPEQLNDIALSPGSPLMVSCSTEGEIALWDIRSTPELCTKFDAHEVSILSVNFSADGTMFASTSLDKTVKIWEEDGTLCKTFNNHTAPVTSAAFSRDKRWVISSSEDGTIEIWDSNTASEACRVELHVAIHHVRFSDCENFIETDRGSKYIGAPPKFEINANAPQAKASFTEADRKGTENSNHANKPPRSGSELHSTVFVTDDWISADGRDIVWLPESHAAECLAVCDNIVVLGHRSGAISFFNL